MTASFTPRFLGGRNGPLYGVHHVPSHDADRSHGVLFLPPLGQDYKRCHKTLQKLARDLARAGFHVLRFDYAGSGDSAALDAWSLETWREDAQDALDHLQTISGARDLSAFGVRLAAGIAMNLGTPLTSLVLWDPIGDGQAYLEELEQLNREFLLGFRHSFRRGGKVEAPPDQLVGHAFPAALRESLDGFRLDPPEKGVVKRSLWIDAEATPATADHARFEGRLADQERHCRVDTACHWRTLAEIGNLIMGQPVGRQVLRHLKDE